MVKIFVPFGIKDKHIDPNPTNSIPSPETLKTIRPNIPSTSTNTTRTHILPNTFQTPDTLSTPPKHNPIIYSPTPSQLLQDQDGCQTSTTCHQSSPPSQTLDRDIIEPTDANNDSKSPITLPDPTCQSDTTNPPTQISQTQHKDKKEIIIAQQNLQRSPHGMLELRDLSDTISADLLFICEHHTIHNKVSSIPSTFTAFHHPTNHKAAIISTNNRTKVSILQQHTCELMCSALVNNYIVMCCVYLPPRCDSLDTILNLLESLITNYRQNPIILAGDFNSRHEAWDDVSNPQGVALFNFTNQHSLIINGGPLPTFSNHNGSSVIDLIITNQRAQSMLSTFQQISVLDTVHSDHAPQIIYLNSFTAPVHRNHLKSTWMFDESQADWEGFESSIENHNFLISDPNSNIDDTIHTLVDTIFTCANNHIPLKKSPVISSSRPPYWDDEVIESHKLLKKLKRSLKPNDPNASSYALKKSQFKELVNNKMNAFWQAIVNDHHGTSQFSPWGNTYHIISNKLNPKNRAVPILEGANPHGIIPPVLEHFFPTANATSSSSRQITPPKLISSDKLPQSLFKLIPFDAFTNIINNLNIKKAPGPDNISNGLLKHLPLSAIRIIYIIVLNCLHYSYFPTVWKTATVKLMLKPGKKDHTSLSSYRPISLTSHLSKLLESIIHTHLYHHIERHHLLTNTQFGFRTGRSTIHVLENIFTTISTSSTRFCAVANFDFRGAFDNISHQLILDSINSFTYPLNTNITNIVKSYLYNRTYTMSLANNLTIYHHTQGKGCPQGGILSPILWNIGVNSLLVELKEIPHIKVFAFADDISVVLSANQIQQIESSIHLVLNVFQRWKDLSSVELNISKCNLMFYKNCATIQNCPLNIVQSVKVLGITFDHKLKCNDHVINKVAKFKKFFNIIMASLYKQGPVSSATKLLIYNCAIRPSLTYGCQIWADRINKVTWSKLESAQHQVLRACISGYRDISMIDTRCLTRSISLQDYVTTLNTCHRQNPKPIPMLPNTFIYTNYFDTSSVSYNVSIHTTKSNSDIIPTFITKQDNQLVHTNTIRHPSTVCAFDSELYAMTSASAT